MSDSYHVRIQKERHVFSAAHFITYAGDVCEPLHGHNYHVYAEINGPLDENQYVIDFICVRDALQRIVDSLDHRVLLPTEHPTIHVAEQHEGDTSEVIAQHEKRRWTFPRADCVLLPVANTTAELLAKYIADELLAALGEADRQSIDALEVGVDECDGQWGVYRWTRE
jgi:6-pyruvoyltetrahydropterin/6-carboxytetrahydropterin synthase